MRRLVESYLRQRRARDPARAYARIIEARQERHEQARKGVEEMARLQTRLEHEIFERRAEIARLHHNARAAARRGNDDQALSLIKHKQALHERLHDAEGELRQFAEEVAAAERALAGFHDEIRELEREKTRGLAALASAEARRDLREAISSATTRNDPVLNDVREHIGRLNAERTLDTEMDGRALSAELNDLWDDDATVQARIELARLKQHKRRSLDVVNEA